MSPTQMILYHITNSKNAAAIKRDGFRDTGGSYMTESEHRGVEHRGVWLFDRPLDADEGAWGDTAIAVDLPLSEAGLDQYEWKVEGLSRVADTSRNSQQILVAKIGPPRFSSLDTVTRHKGRQSPEGHKIPRDGAIIFADLIGKLDLLRVACDKCGAVIKFFNMTQQLHNRRGPSAGSWRSALRPDRGRRIGQCRVRSNIS